MKRGEEGAALLTVLLLVAVMSVIAAAALEKLKFGTRLAQNGASIDQARSYGLAAETIARYRIGDLLAASATKTTLQGDWAARPQPFPIDDGIATAQLDDGGNCFNLNSLVTSDGVGGQIARPAGVEQFERLMRALQIPSNEAPAIARAAADWIDSDDAPLPGGAEDSAYQGYRTANTLMADPSELRAVAGVRPQVYTRLRPYLCALPVTDLSPININTLAPDRAALVAMLVPGLDPDRARRVLDDRPPLGYDAVGRFWDQPALAAAPAQAREQTSVRTRWFDLKVVIELAGAELEQHSLIDAAQLPPRIVHRSYGDPS